MRVSIVIAGLCTSCAIATSASAAPPAQAALASAVPGSDPVAAAPPPVVVEAPARPVEEAQERTAKNAIYAEGLGPALLYSINYERSFSDFALRAGFGYVSLTTQGSDGTTHSQASASFIAVPITLSYLGIGSLRHMLEVGAGAGIFHVGAGATTVGTDSSTTASGSATVVLPHAVLGYRFQPPGGGFMLKTGLSAIFAGSAIPVLPWPYLALGGSL